MTPTLDDIILRFSSRAYVPYIAANPGDKAFVDAPAGIAVEWVDWIPVGWIMVSAEPAYGVRPEFARVVGKYDPPPQVLGMQVGESTYRQSSCGLAYALAVWLRDSAGALLRVFFP